MRKLSLLVIALLLARFGVVILTESQPPAGYQVRDALILAAIAVVLFVFNSPPWSLAPTGHTLYRRLAAWPLSGRFFAALGVGLALAAGSWLAWLAPGGVSSETPALAVTGLWITAVVAFMVGVLWPGPPLYTQPRYRWETDAAGRFVRRVLAGSGEGDSGRTRVGAGARRGLILLAVITIVAALALRLAELAELPPACIGSECVRALSLAATDAGVSSGMAEPDAGPVGTFLLLLARFIFEIAGDGLWSLRLAAALLACGLLPVLYGSARVYTRGGGAAAAVIVLAFSPWHLWAARLSLEWIAVPLLVGICLWAGARALRGQALGWWAVLGLGLGGLLVETPPLRFYVLIWAFLSLLLGLLAGRRAGLGWSLGLARLALVPAGMVTAGMPGIFWQSTPAVGWGPGEFRHTLGDLILALIQPPAQGIMLAPESGPGAPLLSAWVAAGALLGAAYLLRHLTRLPALWLVSSAALWGVGVLSLDWLVYAPVGALLPLLPFVLLGFAVGMDAILATFQQVWRPLISMPRGLAGALTLVLILMIWRIPGLVDALGTVDTQQATTVDTAMGRYLAQCLTAPVGTLCDYAPEQEPPLVYVPQSLLTSPGVRLIVGPALQEERVRGLDITRDLLPMGEGANQGRVYFVPLENQQLLEILQQVYPDAQAIAPATDAGPTLFAVFRVAPELLAERQGLQGAYAQGESFVVASAADLVRRDGPLLFPWADAPPLAPPFTVAWEGSLVVPQAGIYEFQADGGLPGPTTGESALAGGQLPHLSLQLDDRLVLDSSLGMTEQRIALAQGPYRLRLYLRVDAAGGVPADLAIRWRPPGQDFQPIPRSALYSPPLPQIGLLGTYYAGSQWEGPVLTQRKDLLLEPAIDLPPPYSIRWEGKIAAPRAGEYIFAVSGDGLTQILIDGRFLLDYMPARDLGDDPGFAQAGIYLNRGWRNIEIRHAPNGPRSNLRILWQPPGSGPELMRSRYLLPLLGEVTSGEIALPPLPELWDARLGDDMFALSYMLEMVTRDVGLPPASLPALPVGERWAFAQCGSGPVQLNAPHGVAIDPEAGRVYVADTGNRRVAVFDLATGAPIGAWAAPELEEPTDLALYRAAALEEAESPQLFVLDAVAHPIFRIDVETGEFAPIPMQTGFYRPRGFDVDENGVFWVADTGGARVAAVDGAGQLLTQMGGQATVMGRGQPVDVLAINGVRWAVTAEDGRLWHLETSGSIPALQRVNTIDGPHLAGLPNGSFLLTDPLGRSFTLHAPSGEPLRRFTLPDGVVHPTGIAAAPYEDGIAVAVVDSSACGLSLWHMPAGQ